MVALALPVLVIVTGCVFDVPVFTFPKPKALGLAASCARDGCVPLPESGISRGELEASLATVTVPVYVVIDVGLKTT
jgi:hypothetical protein